MGDLHGPTSFPSSNIEDILNDRQVEHLCRGFYTYFHGILIDWSTMQWVVLKVVQHDTHHVPATSDYTTLIMGKP